MRRGRGLMVVAMLSMLAPGGCTGGSEDPPTTPEVSSPAPSPSETSSPTPTPDAATPPERPDMSTFDTQTAEAVALYFLQLFPYVAATGDLSDWQLLSHPECVFCAEVQAEVEAVFAAGNHSEGGLFAIDEASTAQVSDDWWLVTVHLTQEPSTTRNGSGVVVEDFPERKALRLDVAVVPQDGHLVVREVDSTREG